MYYTGDNDVQQDSELQQWITDINTHRFSHNSGVCLVCLFHMLPKRWSIDLFSFRFPSVFPDQSRGVTVCHHDHLLLFGFTRRGQIFPGGLTIRMNHLLTSSPWAEKDQKRLQILSRFSVFGPLQSDFTLRSVSLVPLCVLQLDFSLWVKDCPTTMMRPPPHVRGAVAEEDIFLPDVNNLSCPQHAVSAVTAHGQLCEALPTRTTTAKTKPWSAFL